MTPAEARDRYGISTSHASDGDVIVTDDGPDLIVLESTLDGSQTVLHADAVQYDSPREHPFVWGLVGFGVLVTSLFGPLAAGITLALEATTLLVTLAGALGGVVACFLVAQFVLYETAVRDWLFRFLEWNDHKTLIESKRTAHGWGGV